MQGYQVMNKEPSSKEITLQTNWKQHVIGYVLSLLAVPLFGIGLAAFYWVWKRHHRIRYRITDTHITSIGGRYRRNIDLINIERITVEQSWLQRHLGVGTVVLYTPASRMELTGMGRPQRLRDTIEQAVAYQKEAATKSDFREKPDPKYKPGSMDKMDYLTGLWQQGLLSDEDFDNERKNFE